MVSVSKGDLMHVCAATFLQEIPVHTAKHPHKPMLGCLLRVPRSVLGLRLLRHGVPHNPYFKEQMCDI